VVLLGSIENEPALLLAERAAFTSDPEILASLAPTLRSLKNIGTNDIYHWFLAGSSPSQPPDLKINLIFPCTAKHITKYSPQQYRMVTETPEIYATHVRPYMAAQRDEGRLSWVFNIINGLAEQEDVFYRENHPETGFLVSPDLNWDRKTMTALHVLALVERRDIWSFRDLKRDHVDWLKRMMRKILDAVIGFYKDVEEDQLKLYVHCKSLLRLFCSCYCCLSIIFRSTDLLPFSCSCCSCRT
jgi:m7GpppX diphosphatase